MDPQLSGFALGLLFAAAKVGALGTIGFAIAWWRTHRKLQRLQATLPEPGRLEERLANLEQASDYTVSKLADLLDAQGAVLRQLGNPAARPGQAENQRPEPGDKPVTPH